MREGERHSGGEGVGAAPDEAERAQPRRVEDVQRIEPRINRLGALEVYYRRERAIAQARGDLASAAHDPDAPIGFCFQPEQACDERHRLTLGVGEVERGWQ